MADSLRKDLAQTALASLALGIVVGALFSVRNFVPLQVAVNIGVSTLYSLSIGIPTSLVLRRLRPRLHGKPALRQWAIYTGVMLVVVGAGTLFTGFVLVLIGLVPIDEMWTVYVRGVKIALLIALPVTFGAYTVSRLQGQLETTEGERRTAIALATEARLASLESRVRPHFLFNALNSALALIPEDPRRAEDVLERLCALLRFSLDAHARVVTLAEELRIVTDYLEIERVRFGERLVYRIDAPDELRDHEVPAFAIQTLVENSVKYAVAARKTGATIGVRASRRSDGAPLTIEVADDGPGFSGDVWQDGHGLDNLRARLHALHGDAARLEIAPASADGARVTLELPAKPRRAAAA